MASTYTLTNDYRGGPSVSVTVSGHLSLDEMLDALRGFMVACGYVPDIARRLDIMEPDDDTN